ncbi:MAG: thioredoxin family protein, partial [Hyphococcus sp.]
RQNGAALYRRMDDAWRAQVDDASTLESAAPVFLKSGDLDPDAYLDSYTPGDNATLFSPQGGLRASVSDLIALLDVLRHDPGYDEIEWTYTESPLNGDTEGGFYLAFGRGVHHAAGNDHVASGLTLVGHSGEAYGLHSGAWLIRAAEPDQVNRDIRIAFAITGAAAPIPKGAHPTFNAAEERLMRLALRAAGHADKSDQRQSRHDDHEPRPFDASRNAMMDVDAALAAAAISSKRPLLVLGGNWCHDSRGLAAKFQRQELASVIEDNYELVWIDVGRRDRNLDVAERFGVDKVTGTPTVLVLSPEGDLLNADSVHDWRRADSISYADTLAYFQEFAALEDASSGRD